MTLKGIIHAVCLLGLLAVPVFGSGEDGKPAPWGYSGKDDPKEWSKLDPAYAACGAGTAQSPIDLKAKKIKTADLPPLQFDYRPATLSIINNGHSIQVNYPAGSTLTVGGHVYKLVQFHFHHPSENHENGKALPLEVHLVHADADGKLAVVAVFFDVDKPNPLIDVAWRNIPEKGEKGVDVSASSINPTDLLPANRGYYSFVGSLTTPPCSEGVSWYVVKTHMTVSKEQLDQFAKIFKKNARPTQPLNGRAVVQTR
jgi:carbonic anhydrase